MPTPHKNEKESEYVSRCSSNPEMISKHPDQKERLAVCYSMFKQHQKKTTSAWIADTLDIKLKERDESSNT